MASGNKILKRASPSTIHDKFLVGYQGWFSCEGDGEPIYPGHSGWLHWFNGDRPNVDVWPDVSSYSPSELFPARDMKLKTGQQAFLFSSRHPKTVQRHFHWMAEHGIDGAFLQRFAEQSQPGQENSIRKLRDEVGQLVREAAEKEGRVFAIMYDVSSVPADRIQSILERDWIHLIHTLSVLDSPNYLTEKGMPVIGLWGFGFHNRGHTPELVRSIIKFFRTVTPGGAYIFGGAPSCWRLSEGDADRHPEFVDVWLNEFDAISPWTIGRYKNEADADRFAESKMKGDMELITRRNEETGRKVDYVPVVHPGGSGFNLSKGKWAFNDAPRTGGRFLWKQIFNAKRLGVRSLYGAMWDEYDEGTAFMPIVTHKRNLPESDIYQFMALDEEGYDLPSDWYMRICGMAAESLRSERWIHETFPVKELQDYWSSRPKYEEIETYAGETVAGPSNSGSKPEDEIAGGEQPGYQQWLASQKDDKDEPPPPPYSLLAEEEESVPSNAPTAQTQQTATGPSSSALTPSPSAYGTPAPTPQITNVSESVPGAAQASSVHSLATPPVVAGVEPPRGSTPSTMQNLPSTSHITPHVASTSYFHEQPNVNVPKDHTVPFAGSTSLKPLPPSPTPSDFQGQPHHRLHRPSDAVLSLASDFARTTVTGPLVGSSFREESSVVGPPAAATPVATGRLDAVSPPPLHPAHPAANNPASYGRPSVSHPHGSRPNPSPHSHAQAAGPWSAANWPPKEWGISSDPSPTPSRLQSVSGSSSATSGGANLRPNTSISGPPPPPNHSRPHTRPNTAGGAHPQPPVHTQATSSYPQLAVSENPPVSFPEVPSHNTHTPSPHSPGYGPAPYHSGPSASHNTHSPTSPSFGGPAPYHNTHSPTSPSFGGPAPYHNTHLPSTGGPAPYASHSTHLPSTGGPAPYASHSTQGLSRPSPGGYGSTPYQLGPAASNSHHTPSHHSHHHNVGGFMASTPNLGHPPPLEHHSYSFPQPSMPAPWASTGPGMPVGPTGPVGPVGPIGPNSMHTGQMYIPQQPGPQYAYGTHGSSGGTNNNALNYALSAVDMVAGRKTRDQLQGLANKFLR